MLLSTIKSEKQKKSDRRAAAEEEVEERRLFLKKKVEEEEEIHFFSLTKKIESLDGADSASSSILRQDNRHLLRGTEAVASCEDRKRKWNAQRKREEASYRLKQIDRSKKKREKNSTSTSTEKTF